jgi:hypothetical protein
MSSQSSKSRGKIVLKKNKTINKIWHPESTLVFKSSNEKLVIGRFQDGEVIPLDDEALDLCVQWKFKYDTSLVDEEEVTDSDEGDVEEEPVPVKKTTPEPEQVSESESEDEPEPAVEEQVSEEPAPTPELTPELTPEPTPEPTPAPTPTKVSRKTEVPDLAGDTNLQVGIMFTNLDSEVSLLHKNIDRILGDVQSKASTEIATLSNELSVTKSELSTTKDALATMTKDFEDTKAKLAKIRSALGF